MNLLFIAQDFPSALDRTCGLFNEYLVRAMAERHDVRVICPVSWIAGRGKRGQLHPQTLESKTGRKITVEYPRYYYTPKILRNQYGRFMAWSVKGAVRRALSGWRPDAVVGYWAHPDGYVACKIARKYNIPSAVIVGGSDVLLLTQDPSRRRQVLDVLHNVTSIFAVNEHLKQSVQEMGVNDKKIHVWSQGVDDRFHPGDRTDARTRLGIAKEGSAMVWVGRMVQVKGLEVLIEACKILREKMPFNLYLVGDGALRKPLEAQAAAAGLADCIHFPGLQSHDRLPDWYRAADLSVLSSWSEGLPNVLRESLASGTPFVATRVGGIHEIAGDRTDWLVPAGDAPGFAAAMHRGLTTPQEMPTGFKPLRWSDSAKDMINTLRAAREEREVTMNPLGASKPRSLRQIARRILGRVMPRKLYLSGPQKSGAACLTFDDGPHPVHTPHLLDILRDTGTRATFFVVGKNAERYPDIVRRMVHEGHTVGHHTYSHGDPGETSASQLMDEVRRTRDLLMPLLGEDPNLFRPPLGKLTISKFLRLWLAGQNIVLWDLDSKDFACKSSSELAERMQRFPPAAGNIVLLHDNVPHTANVLPTVIASAKKRGVVFTTLREWTR